MRAPNERCETPPLAIGAGAGGASAGVACWYEACLPPNDPVIIGIECPAAFLLSRGLFPSSAPIWEIGVHGGQKESARALRASLFCSPPHVREDRSFSACLVFFPVEAIYFPSFPSFVLSFFRWFFWQQAINPIIGLAEPLSAPPLSTALPYLSLSYFSIHEY